MQRELSHHNTSYKVRIADANANAKLKVPSMFEMLQEAATEHAQKLGIDFSKLAPMGLGWALVKLSINISRMPSWNERVYIDTWPSKRERIATFREFCARDAAGGGLFAARSQWVVFNLAQRRLARLERLEPWPADPDKTATNETFETPLKKPDPEKSDKVPCRVRLNDIDLNGHVNNSIYIVWAMEALGDDFLRGKSPSKIDISFLEEIKLKDEVLSICQICGGETLHSIVNGQTGRECARINVEWR